MQFKRYLALLAAAITMLFAFVVPFAITTALEAIASSYGAMMLTPSTTRTYRSTTGYFTTAATASDIARLPGNGTTTVKVLGVYVTQLASNINSNADFYLVKRSTANSGGTAVSNTVVPLDSNNSAANSTPQHYTANPTTGSLVGRVAHYFLNSGQTGAGWPQPGSYTFPLYVANTEAQAITLRGTSQELDVNLNGVTDAIGTSVSVTWEYLEQ